MFLKYKKSEKISSIAVGAVQVVAGKVITEKAVTIPGTDIECACYWMMIENWQHGIRGKGRKMWVLSAIELGCNGFFIEDDSGRIWVDNTSDALDIRNGWEDRWFNRKNKKQRFITRSIKAGDIVKVRGMVATAEGLESSRHLVLRPDTRGQISIIQKKKSGKLVEAVI